MTGLCSTCRHWARDSDLDSWNAGHRWHGLGARDCRHPNLKAIAFGEFVEMEGISTLPDFGCIQHEPPIEDK